MNTYLLNYGTTENEVLARMMLERLGFAEVMATRKARMDRSHASMLEEYARQGIPVYEHLLRAKAMNLVGMTDELADKIQSALGLMNQTVHPHILLESKGPDRALDQKA